MNKDTSLQLIKPNPVLEIAAKLSLLQHKAFNALLVDARYKFESEEYHEIRAQELFKEISFDSKDEILIKRALKVLLNVAVTWSVFDEKGHEE